MSYGQVVSKEKEVKEYQAKMRKAEYQVLNRILVESSSSFVE